ncbi:hypothetical protein ACJMK2_034661 [Sinanodonta woodiana]|uniref:G-protein coupled receptors family 1 profile domain-containing protein n=1 Tax=Sinanodonta woodiana TaxID=1069815 RepID=A0ABD3WSB4_SINWO
MESQKKQMTPVAVLRILPILWVFSFLISIPAMIEFYVTEEDTTVTIQATNGTNTTYYTMKSLACDSHYFSFQYGLFNVIFNYAQLVFYIWKKGRQIGPGNGGRQNSVFYKQRLRLVTMLTFAAAIFALSWLPYFVVQVIAKIYDQDGSEFAAGFLNMFLIAMATFSTMYNVLLYTVFNINFRLAFKTLLLCKKENTVSVFLLTSLVRFITHTENSRQWKVKA